MNQNSHNKSLQLTHLHKLSRSQRIEALAEFAELSKEDQQILSGEKQISADLAENWIENVVGYFSLPMGVASNFNVNGKDYLIPMAVEESSIIAAASVTARWVKENGTITTRMRDRLIIGQIQIPRCQNSSSTIEQLRSHEALLKQVAHAVVPGLVDRGGGVRSFEYRCLPRPDKNGEMLIIHVLCDPCQAMGANLINQICERLKPTIEELTGQTVGICILSNLMDQRCVEAEVVLKGIDPDLASGIQEASYFAEADPYRAATHNKGVLNGIDPILIATGNDWRAVEAAVHAYCALGGKYQPVTQWRAEGSTLRGFFKAPIPVGTVGGVTQLHPISKIALKILRTHDADELAQICAAVGLVQNLGAVKALSTVGIVSGHMKLHATNLAMAAGATAEEIPKVRQRLTEVLKIRKTISLRDTQEILLGIRAMTGASFLRP